MPNLICEFRVEGSAAATAMLFPEGLVIVTEGFADRLFVNAGGLIGDANKAARKAKAQERINAAIGNVERSVGVENFHAESLAGALRAANFEATIYASSDVVSVTFERAGFLFGGKPKLTLKLKAGSAKTFYVLWPKHQYPLLAKAVSFAYGARLTNMSPW